MKKPKYLLPLLLFPILNFAQPIQTLFPGDTNNDGICNHYDLLPIGLLYNTISEARNAASLEWVPQAFLAWSATLPVSQVNAGFADCDGDGFVQELDLDAFPLNYDSTQSGSIPSPAPWLEKLTDTLFSSAIPLLRLTFDKDVASEGDTLQATLTYSIPPNHPTHALGIAIWLTYPTENVVDNQLRIEADTTGNELMYVSASSADVNIWRALPPGNIQFTAAARGQNDLEGDDTLACFFIVIEDKIIALADPFSLECKEGLMLNAGEQLIPFLFEKDSVLLERRVAVAEPQGTLATQTMVFPNPVRDDFTIDCPEAIEAVLVMDNSGRELLYEKILSHKRTDLRLPSTLPPGNYLLKIFTRSAVFVKEIQKF